ncbi:hypothetical protein [Psychromicrobium xiongbiense]|uniref:hypothetical protein n=1 Tax=Psychromicrobium xiongbiense TaxID=3051184 RepID=UPI00255746F1|nr:hypothetical protein [Psychromicrobium sp. YIM S02556]
MDPLTESEWRAVGLNPVVVSARLAALDALSDAFDYFATHTHVMGHMLGPDRVSGVSSTGNGDEPLVAASFVLHTGKVLLDGIRTLHQASNTYAVAALVRQLVEVEYLAWACAEDPAEAREWFTSTSEKRRSRWKPGDLRKRSDGQFRDSDYWQHCEIGGHPTPRGVRALITGANQDLIAEITVAEAVKHAFRTWGFALEVLPDELRQSWTEDRWESLNQKIGHWQNEEPFGRLLEQNDAE